MAKSTSKKLGKPSKDTRHSEKVQTKETVELHIADDESNGNSSEDDGLDEAGLENLLKALGNDGLDEFDQAQLRTLAGEDGEEEDSGSEEEEEGEEDTGDVEEGSGSEQEVEEEIIAGSSRHGVDEEDVALDELDAVLDEDTVPRQKVQIDNKVALERIRDTIKLDPSLPWTETLTITYPETTSVDVDDDLNRELAFYKQALHGATTARALASKHNFPFTRPSDYFAEMVKSDSHMERIRQRLLDESSAMKKSEDKRKEREGKKYGKQVQIEKLKERERSKKDMEDRLKGLKRKRKGALDNAQADDEGFDIAVEDAISDRPSKRAKGPGGGSSKNMSRKARDGKFGFGGGGKRAKQNTRSSTDDFGSTRFGGKKTFGKGAKAKTPRPGKSKRMDARTRS